jgi:hypothetical protein
MAGIGKYKLTDALRPRQPAARGGKSTKPVPTIEDAAERSRESKESNEARNAEASIRDRMVGIGRGRQQAGRQGQ